MTRLDRDGSTRQLPRRLNRWQIGLPLIALVVGALVTHYFADDALITLRYSQNLGTGHGLVWNPDGPRVEGYSNFLWVLILAVPAALHVSLVVSAQLLGLLFAGGAVLTAMVLGRQIFPEYAPSAITAAGIVAGGLSPMAVWASGGLETSLFAFLLTISVLGVVNLWSRGWTYKTSLATAVLVALLPLVRPEGALYVGAFCVLLLWGANKARLTWRTAGVAALICIAPLACTELFRLAYFHELLPNTFYVKASNTTPAVLRQGLKYLVRFFYERSAPLWVLAFVPACWAVVKRPRFRIVIAAVAIQCAFVVYGGGDDLIEFRLVAPFLPLLAVATIPLFDLARLAAKLRLAVRPAVLATTPILFAFGMVALSLAQANASVQANRRVESDRRLIGLYLRDHAPYGFVAVSAAGAIPYYSGLRALDILGLNDTHIAHTAPHAGAAVTQQKFDAEYVLRAQPDIVPLGIGWLTSDPTLPSRDALIASYEAYGRSHFFQVYVALLRSSSPSYDIVALEVAPGRWLQALVRRGFHVT